MPDQLPREPGHLERRPLLKLVAGGVVALGAVGGGARVYLHRDPDAPGAAAGGTDWPSRPGLTLAADPGSDVGSLYVALDDALLPASGRRTWESARLPTSTHSMVAFTWTDPDATPHLRVRSRVNGAWGDWLRVPLLHDVPDADSGEATAVTGTDLVWIGPSDGIQVRLGGQRPDDLRLLLLHPAARAADRGNPPSRTRVTPLREGRLAAGGAAARTTASRSSVRPALARAVVRPVLRARAPGAVAVTRPEVLNRAAWGADESWRSGRPQLVSTIEQVHVHHTVTRNDYLPEDVPALIRGMYRYHTATLGWSDIAYNFLVDRFGRIWTGRAGGAAKPVRGAHTLGFNATSCGVSVIGNLDQVAPTTETLDAVAAVAAWKLSEFGRDPLGTATVTSEGSDKFSRGRAVALPVLDGHRDTNDTSCPGTLLYAQLGEIRNRAAARIAAAQAPVTVTSPGTVTGTALLGETLTATPGSYEPASAVATFTWLRDGAPIAGASGPTYVVGPDDVGRSLGVRVDATAVDRPGTSQTVAAPGPVLSPGVVRLTLTPRPRRVVVKIEVTGKPGTSVPPAEGTVAVTSGTRTRTVTLSGGRGKTKFKNVKAGEHELRASYSGGGLLRPARRKATVTVPDRRRPRRG